MADLSDFKFHIETDINKTDLEKKIESFQPWGHWIEFSNGVSTADYKLRTPFNKFPLRKISRCAKIVDFESYRGKKMLDIGCNVGYNSMHCEAEYDLKVTGIDFAKRNIDRANFFKKISNSSCEFLVGDAEEFRRNEEFDIIIHFGTLYHLPNPIRSIQLCYDNMRPGGTLILETQVYEREEVDQNLCYYMHGFNNDKTNFWAISPSVMKRIMENVGFVNAKELSRAEHRNSIPGMYRAQFVANKT